MKIIGAVGKGILNNLPIIISASVNIVLTLLKALIDALPQIVDGALQLVIALATESARALLNWFRPLCRWS